MSEKRILINKRRRQRQLKRNLFAGSFTCLLILIFVITFGNSFVKANSPKNQLFKYYASIQIKQGETLWGIAEEYMSLHYDNASDYIEEVMEINHLKNEEIHAGEFLIVPYFSSEFIGL